MQPTKENILKIYQLCPGNGRNWYKEANGIAQKMSAMTGLAVYQTAGIIAALSCNKSWQANLNLAWEFCQADSAGHTEIVLNKCRRITKTANREEIAVILNGPKIQNFFLNIAEPEACGPVTVDRHTWNAAVYGKRTTSRFICTAKRYRETAEVYRETARELGIMPHELQAVVWTNYLNL